MGILTTDGPPMTWGTEKNNQALNYVRDHGIKQLLNIFQRYKDVKGYPFLWGDEIEHILVQVDPATGETRLALNAAPILEELNHDPVTTKHCGWRPEYGSFMVESVPADPYVITVSSLLSVEGNMKERCQMIDSKCDKKKGERSVMLVSFPLLGVGEFHSEPSKTERPYSESLFIPDICINQTHPRFGTLTRNIRLRRGRKVCIQIPMFMDRFTLKRSVDPTYNIDLTPQNRAIQCGGQPTIGTKRPRTVTLDSDDENDTTAESDEAIAARKAKSRTASTEFSADEADFFRHIYTPSSHYYYAQYGVHDSVHVQNVSQRYNACPCPVVSVAHPCVYMDCMVFGMGLSCLQVTMQLDNVTEARHVYDQVIPICPLLLALSSATPVQKGFLCDSDVRWVTISASVDDRRPDEVPRIMKSRYDSVSLYLSPLPLDLDCFNSNHVEIEDKYFKQIQEAGIDSRLARHFAHLFIRDPLVIYEQGIEQLDDTKRSDHFENVQTTNWQTVRFKPPPFDSPIGWRVEFRPMEVQPTAFENAAFAVFVALLVKATLKFKTNYYLPMHLVDTNMGIAHLRDPTSYKYSINININAPLETLTLQSCVIHELTLDQIMNGCTNLPLQSGKPEITTFEGLIPLVRRYIVEEKLSDPKLENYLQLLSRRAKGELLTPAQLFRKFVQSHKDYQQDSHVTQTIGRDFVAFAAHLSDTQVWPGYLPAELTGGVFKPFNGWSAAGSPAGSPSKAHKK